MKYSYSVKLVLRLLPKFEQHTKFCIDSKKGFCYVYLHDVIAMGYTALHQITACLGEGRKL